MCKDKSEDYVLHSEQFEDIILVGVYDGACNINRCMQKYDRQQKKVVNMREIRRKKENEEEERR
jgi:hypothetical protein